MGNSIQRPIARFEDFEVNLETGEVWKAGRPLKVQDQPFRVLAALLERPSQIVTREELRQRIWPDKTFGDFDHAINLALTKLRAALGDSADVPHLIETLPRRGYRFIAPLKEQGDPPAGRVVAPLVKPSMVATPSVSGSAPVLDIHTSSVADDDPRDQGLGKQTARETADRHRHAHRWLFAGAVFLFALVGFAAYKLARSRAPDAKLPKITSIAVMPLKNLSGDPAQEYLADGMTEELIGRLSTIHGLRVISRTSIMQFKNTRLLTPEIARALGVDALVEGSVIREGNRIRVHAQLIRASTDEHFWSETYDRELGDALTLESEVAESIEQRVEVTLTGEERARLVAARPVSPEAYENYLKGLVAKEDSRAEIEKRLAYFNEAIRKDPTFAPAYVGLAEAYWSLGTILIGGAPPTEARARVISNAQKALELDPELADAYVILASTHESQWRWAEAETEYRRALDLNPNDAAAHEGFSDWLLCHGRVEEALGWARRGRELDPVGPRNFGIVWILFNARRYDEAIQESRNALGVNPDNGSTLRSYGLVLIFNHQAEEAIPVLEKAVSVTGRNPGVIGFLVWAYARGGRRADALRLLDELKKRQQTGYVPPAAFMNAYLGLEDNNEALAWLESASREQSNVLKIREGFPAA